MGFFSTIGNILRLGGVISSAPEHDDAGVDFPLHEQFSLSNEDIHHLFSQYITHQVVPNEKMREEIRTLLHDNRDGTFITLYKVGKLLDHLKYTGVAIDGKTVKLLPAARTRVYNAVKSFAAGTH